MHKAYNGELGANTESLGRTPQHMHLDGWDTSLNFHPKNKLIAKEDLFLMLVDPKCSRPETSQQKHKHTSSTLQHLHYLLQCNGKVPAIPAKH